MNLREFESRGFYEPGFLHIRINTDKSLKNLNDLQATDKSLFSTFLHEYIHFLQEVTTTTGLTYASFYINTIKDINQNIINDGKNEFKVPFEFNNEYNTLTQIELRKTYQGETPDVTYAKYDYYIEEVKQIKDREKNVINIKQFKVFYYDSGRKYKNFYFGTTCLKEFPAHFIQTNFCPEIQHPDIPYVIAELILDKECPSLSKNKDFYLTICDACLMSFHPAQIFFNTIERIKNNNFIPKTAEEVYYYTLDLKFNGNGEIYSPDELFEESKKIVIDHFENALQANIFSTNLNWIKHILDEASTLRKDNPTYMTKILSKDGKLSTLFYSIFDKLGTPYFSNNLDDGGLIPPKNLADLPHQPYQLLVFKEILNIYKGEQNCSLYNLCNKPESQVITNEFCQIAPWERAKGEQLCPFGQLWKTWALTNEVPIKKEIGLKP